MWTTDAEASIRIMTHCLEQVGIDPISHHYDIDVLYTGRPTVLNSKLLKVLVVFSELERLSAMVIEADLQGLIFERYGMSRSTVTQVLQTLVREEIIIKVPYIYKRRNT